MPIDLVIDERDTKPGDLGDNNNNSSSNGSGGPGGAGLGGGTSNGGGRGGSADTGHHSDSASTPDHQVNLRHALHLARLVRMQRLRHGVLSESASSSLLTLNGNDCATLPAVAARTAAIDERNTSAGSKLPSQAGRV